MRACARGELYLYTTRHDTVLSLFCIHNREEIVSCRVYPARTRTRESERCLAVGFGFFQAACVVETLPACAQLLRPGGDIAGCVGVQLDPFAPHIRHEFTH
jgi:hypothetical protein